VTRTVGVFGLGLIGRAAAERLRAAGMAVVGHDPGAEAQAAFAAMGGRVAAPDDVWKAPTVLIAVFDAAQAREVLASAPEGTAADLMVLTTCDPAGIASLETVAGGCTLVEAPVSGTSAQLARGEATVWLAGEGAAVERVWPVAEALSGRVVRLGGFGEGARVKLCVNLVLGLNRAALAEGLLLARGLGLDPARFLELARGSAAASAVMATKGPRMVSGDFAPEGRVTQSAKDFGLILAAADAAGVGLPFARTYAGLMQELIAAGEGGLDNAAIIRALEGRGTGPIAAQDAAP
jgi:3-hydroxyisobutyrate dehydrogenase-like beta-hydroxyacid dehydrogenase